MPDVHVGVGVQFGFDVVNARNVDAGVGVVVGRAMRDAHILIPALAFVGGGSLHHNAVPPEAACVHIFDANGRQTRIIRQLVTNDKAAALVCRPP